MHVLLVEDDPLIRLLVEAVLRMEGLEVRSVAGVAEAIDALGARPDLILADLGLLDGDGRSVVAAARAIPDWDPRIVLVSALAERELALIAGALGVEYLGKPFRVAALRAVLTAPWPRDVLVS